MPQRTQYEYQINSPPLLLSLKLFFGVVFFFVGFFVLFCFFYIFPFNNNIQEQRKTNFALQSLCQKTFHFI